MISLVGFFDELEKIGVVKEGQGGIVGRMLTNAMLKNVSQNPVKYVAAMNRHDKGLERHRRMMEAVEEGTPAGWVPLGMHAG